MLQDRITRDPRAVMARSVRGWSASTRSSIGLASGMLWTLIVLDGCYRSTPAPDAADRAEMPGMADAADDVPKCWKTGMFFSRCDHGGICPALSSCQAGVCC